MQTDGLHQWLRENPERLRAHGLELPLGLRLKTDNAHHALADEIRLSPHLTHSVSALVEHAAKSRAQRLLVSSENFFHCLTGGPFERFLRVLTDIRKVRLIKLVVSLPPIDRLIQAFYLHSIRQGEPVETFDTHLQKRWGWGLELLSSIEKLKKSGVVDELCILTNPSAQDNIADLVQALTMPQDVGAHIGSQAQSIAPVGLKTHSALLYLDQLNQQSEMRLSRQSILRATRSGALTLDDTDASTALGAETLNEDGAQFDLFSSTQRACLHEAMAHPSQSVTLFDSSEFLPTAPEAAKPFARLSLDVLADTQHDLLRELNHGRNRALQKPVGKVSAVPLSPEAQQILHEIAATTVKIPKGAARIDGPLAIFNENGNKPPIFWCFNNWAEPVILANRLGPDQPLVAMRSLHAFVKGHALKTAYFEQVATAYCDLISELLNLTPMIIGGNCQAAPIAEQMAQIQSERSEKSPLLITLEHYPKHPYQGSVLLLFGAKSLKYNPLVYDIDPDLFWAGWHGTLSWGLLNAGHGKYFIEPGIRDFAHFIKLAAAVFGRSGKIEQGEWIAPASELCA